MAFIDDINHQPIVPTWHYKIDDVRIRFPPAQSLLRTSTRVDDQECAAAPERNLTQRISCHFTTALPPADIERTKAALAAAKARGVKLGGRPENLQNTALGWRRSAQTRRARAGALATDLLPIIEAIQAEGITSFGGIAKVLQ